MVDGDTSEKQHGYMSVNKKIVPKGIFNVGENTRSVSRTDVFVFS